jgi:hypothetical protein
MKNKILLSAVMLTIVTTAFSQEKRSGYYYDTHQNESVNTSLKEKINIYTVKIDSIVSSEKKKMNEELNAVDKNFKDGKITSEEKRNHNTEIATKYEVAINEKVDAEKGTFEEITRERVKRSVLGKSSDEKKRDMRRRLNNGGIQISAGFINLTNSSQPFNFFNKPEEIRFGQSGSYSIQFKFEMQIGEYSSPLLLNFGLGFRGDTYDVGGSMVFAQGNGKLFQETFTGGNLKYSQLKTEYIEIPVGVQFVLNPKYVTIDGEKFLDNDKKQLRIGVGVYGGVKIGNRIKYKYSDEASNSNVFRQRVEDGINPFIFGGKLSIGYGGISLYVKKDLTPIFNSDALMNNKNSLQIGLEIFNLTF